MVFPKTARGVRTSIVKIELKLTARVYSVTRATLGGLGGH